MMVMSKISSSRQCNNKKKLRYSTNTNCVVRIGFALCICIVTVNQFFMLDSGADYYLQQHHDNNSSWNVVGTESSSSSSLNLHHQHRHNNHTTATTKNNIEICFVTAEFSESIELADQVPVLTDPTMIREPPRNFAFANLPNITTSKGWEVILLENLPYKRMITKSRWPKFLGWQHPRLIQQQQQRKCQIIFYGDAYLLNPTNESIWQHMAQLILNSDVGLMQEKQIGNNNKPVKGPGVELRKNARIGKVSWDSANKTISWLKSQPDYQLGIPVYKNALFGYDPTNSKFQNMVIDFWSEYSKEDGRSWRDQPYWAYFLYKHQMKPLKFPFEIQPILGPQGKRGHNDHIYVKKPTATTTTEEDPI